METRPKLWLPLLILLAMAGLIAAIVAVAVYDTEAGAAPEAPAGRACLPVGVLGTVPGDGPPGCELSPALAVQPAVAGLAPSYPPAIFVPTYEGKRFDDEPAIRAFADRLEEDGSVKIVAQKGPDRWLAVYRLRDGRAVIETPAGPRDVDWPLLSESHPLEIVATPEAVYGVAADPVTTVTLRFADGTTQDVPVRRNGFLFAVEGDRRPVGAAPRTGAGAPLGEVPVGP